MAACSHQRRHRRQIHPPCEMRGNGGDSHTGDTCLGFSGEKLRIDTFFLHTHTLIFICGGFISNNDRDVILSGRVTAENQRDSKTEMTTNSSELSLSVSTEPLAPTLTSLTRAQLPPGSKIDAKNGACVCLMGPHLSSVLLPHRTTRSQTNVSPLTLV